VKTLLALAVVGALAAIAPAARADGPATFPPPTSEEDVQFELGAGLHRLYDVPIYGGTILFGVGARWDSLAVRFTFGGLLGTTDVGLRALEVQGGASIEGQLSDAWRIGIDIHALYLNMARATTYDDFGSLGPGVRPYISLNLADVADGHLYATAAFEATWIATDDTPIILWGPTLSLGLHF
jgi:hypothetical protein